MKQILTTIYIVIFVMSCREKTGYDSFEQSFSRGTTLKGVVKDHGNNLLGNPTDIRIIDSLLIFLDPGSNSHIVAVSKNSLDTAYHLLPRGKGPYEYGMVRGIEVDQFKNICFFDDNSNNYIETPIGLGKGSMPPSYIANMRLDFGKVLNTTRLGDNLFSIGIFNHENRFLVSKKLKNRETDQMYLTGEYPQDSYPNIPNLKKGMAYQARLRKNEANQIIVAYTLMAGEIKFFEFNNDSIVLMKDFVFNLPIYTSESVGIAVTFASESLVNFLDVCFYGKFVFALFSGKSYKTSGNDAYSGNRIFVFNKNGEPITQIFLDKNISCLDVDIQSDEIYGVTLTPFPKIVTFSLDGVLN